RRRLQLRSAPALARAAFARLDPGIACSPGALPKRLKNAPYRFFTDDRRRSSPASVRHPRRTLSPPNSPSQQLVRAAAYQLASPGFEGERNKAGIPLALDTQDNVLATIFPGCGDLLLQLLRRSHRFVTYGNDKIPRA